MLTEIHHQSVSILGLRHGIMPPVSGVLCCLASAAAFGAMAIFGKLAYAEDVTVGTLLAVRFALAALLFWILVAATGQWRRPARRDVLLALGLGAIGYATQAGLFFTALDRMDAALLSLLLYTFPAMVAVAAVLLGREAWSRRTGAALALASAGLVLVLGGAGHVDGLGVLLGLLAATTYTTYILSSQGVAGRCGPLVLAAIVCTGAAVTLTAGTAALGSLHPEAVTADGWLWLAGIAAVSTVGAVGLFFAGLTRVGPTRASILSTFEPVTTVVLAFAVFGEALQPLQLAGATLVLAAVAALTAPRVGSLNARRHRPRWDEDAGDRRRGRRRHQGAGAAADAA